MEKKKKRFLLKWLLMGTACVLAADVSVGVTWSYLTAKTNDKNNTFRSEIEIKGVIDEPHFNMNQTNYFSPGETVNKDPLVKNVSLTAADMWTGVRLSYFLNPGGLGAVQVDEDTFLKFVAIYNSLKGTAPAVTGYNQDKWSEMAAADFNSGTKNSLCKYFKYSDAVPQNGSTQPVFQSVKPNGAILIPASPDALSGRTTRFENTVQYSGKAYSLMNDNEKRAFLSYVGDHLTDTYYFDSFDFAIAVDGYGVKKSYDVNSIDAAITKITDGLATVSIGI